MAVLDATAPIIASSLFAYIFKCTIDAFPGLCFLILGAISLIPIWSRCQSISLFSKLEMTPKNKTIVMLRINVKYA
jgi:hypothetical protein